VAVELHGAVPAGSEGGQGDEGEAPVSYRLWRHDGLLSSTAVAERVRWQLDGWQPHTLSTEGEEEGGISLLRLIPDQLVPARGVQPGLWGTDETPDRIARAAERLQAMFGHRAVTLPARRGGRTPADQIVRTAFGDLPPTATATGTATGTAKDADDAPWPARLPDPAPNGVPAEPRPVTVTDRSGDPVRVSGRTEISAPPAVLVPGPGAEPLEIVGWAGPWPLSERWWDPDHARRKARFQAVTEDGRAWLLCVQDGSWQAEAVYE
jgi:protein ImuB